MEDFIDDFVGDDFIDEDYGDMDVADNNVDVDDNNNDVVQNYAENRFINVIARLRRNDPTLTLVHLMSYYPYGYAPILGEALRYNDSVSALGIDISRLYDPPNNRNNNNNSNHNDNNNHDVVAAQDATTTTQDECGIELLLQYIRASAALQAVYIVVTDPPDATEWDDDDNNNDEDDEDNNDGDAIIVDVAAEEDHARKQQIAVHELINAVAINSNITEITFQNITEYENRIVIPSKALVQLLQSATTLTSLTVDLEMIRLGLSSIGMLEHRVADDDAIVLSTLMRQSFGSNTSLLKITLEVSRDEQLDLFRHGLKSLQTHPRLQELCIIRRFFAEDTIQVLVSHFLLPKSNPSLRKLELSCNFHQGGSMSNLLQVGINANPHITTLAFTECGYRDDTSQELIDYFQQVDDATTTTTTTRCCGVRRLHFDGHSHRDGKIFAALLSTTRRGRQQQQLEDIQMQNGTEFFRMVISASDGEYRLPRCVRLTSLHESAWEYIQEYLVNHVDLQELVVRGYIDTHFLQTREIVETIRRNGSLQSVTMEQLGEYDQNNLDHRHVPITIFDPAELRLVHAYCQRNQQTSISKPFKSSSMGSLSASSPNITHTNPVPKMMMCIIPTYFFIVRPARRMAPAAIFQILTTADTSIGANAE